MDQSLTSHMHREAVVNFVINLVLNGAIAWFVLRGRGAVEMRGEAGFAPDLLITACLLSGIIAAIVIAVHRRKVARGQMAAVDWDERRTLHRLLRRVPASPAFAGVAFGLFGLLVVGPLTLLGLHMVGATTMAAGSFALFKGLWAGLLAAGIIYPIILIGVGRIPGQPFTGGTCG